MKDLSIEEKAKRYDEALEKTRNIVNSINVGLIGKDCFGAVFPELKESEDERIRKELLQIAKESEDSFYMVMTPDKRKRLIAWLEKQGKHANFRNKIQIGDKVTRNKDGVLVNLSQLNRVAKKQGEQKPNVLTYIDSMQEEKKVLCEDSEGECATKGIDNSLEGIIEAAILWGKYYYAKNDIPREELNQAINYYCSMLKKVILLALK